MRKLWYKAKTDDYRETQNPSEEMSANEDGYTTEVTGVEDHEVRFQAQKEVRE